MRLRIRVSWLFLRDQYLKSTTNVSKFNMTFPCVTQENKIVVPCFSDYILIHCHTTCVSNSEKIFIRIYSFSSEKVDLIKRKGKVLKCLIVPGTGTRQALRTQPWAKQMHTSAMTLWLRREINQLSIHYHKMS
jgi:hypothetical protein